MVNVKLPKTVKLKTYVATTLVLTVLLLASVGYVLTSNGTTVTITPQSYIETASYVIEKIGSTYYAKNGSTGEIEFSGTDASQVIQNCLSNNVKIYIKKGHYTIKNTILVNYDNVTIEGEGSMTELMLDSNANCDLMVVGTIGVLHQEFNLMNIRLHGNKAGNTVGTVLTLCSIYRATIFNVEIFDGAEDGIKCSGSSGKKTYDVEISHSKISYNGENGINFNWTTDLWVQNCIIGYNGRKVGTAGVYLDTEMSIYISDSHIWGNYDGIYGTGCKNILVIGNYLEDNVDDGLHFYNSENITITGNYAWANGGNGYELRGGITQFDWESNLSVDNNSTDFWADSDAKFYSFFGQSEASNDDWIPHRIFTTPTSITVTIEESDANYFLQIKATNTTHFQIYLYDANTGTLETEDKTIYWYAEYKP